MSNWHTCDTTHCRAGWVTFLAGEEGKKLEDHTSTLFAAMQIYKKSSAIKVSPVRFFEKDDQAIADMQRCAQLEIKGQPIMKANGISASVLAPAMEVLKSQMKEPVQTVEEWATFHKDTSFMYGYTACRVVGFDSTRGHDDYTSFRAIYIEWEKETSLIQFTDESRREVIGLFVSAEDIEELTLIES